MALRENLVI